MRWTRRRRRLGYAYPTVVLHLATGCRTVVEGLLEPREVGPDADELAKDPVLHLTFGNAQAGEITATTGKRGYKQDEWSHAARSWDFDGADRQGLLLAAVDAASGVASALNCTTTMWFTGTKEVSVGEKTVVALVRVTQPPASSDPDLTRSDLTISLTSDGNLERTERPDYIPEPMGDDCPQALIDKFDEVRPTGVSRSTYRRGSGRSAT